MLSLILCRSKRQRSQSALLLMVAGLVWLAPGRGIAADEAVAREEIVLGMSTALTGPAAALGQAVRRATGDGASGHD